MKAETIAALQAARSERRAVTLATRLGDAAEALVYRDKAEGPLAGDAAIVAAARRAMEVGRSETVDVGGAKIFLNVYVPPPRLIVVGAVHIAQSLAPMATMLDFDVTVVDPRGAWATDQPLPGREGHAGMGRRGLRRDGPRRLDRRRDPDARSQARRSGARSRAASRTSSMSARSAASAPTPSARTGCARPASPTSSSRASTGRSASTSAPSRRPRSPCRSWARSSRRGRAGWKRWPRPRLPPREIRRDAHRRGGRRHPGAQLARQWRQLRQGPRAVGRRRRQAEVGRRVDGRCGTARSPTTSTRTRPRRRSPRRWRARGSRSPRPSPAAATTSPARRASPWSITSASMR